MELMTTLYNNDHFPQKVFSEEVTAFIFLSFDEIFGEGFLLQLRLFCEDIGCKNILIKNIESVEYHFSEKEAVNGLPGKLREVVTPNRRLITLMLQ